MSSLYVTDTTVPVLLDRLRKREWVVPQFQRDFVWSVADVIKLVDSILDSRPIGMATLWEQTASPEVELEPVWIPDAIGRRFLAGPSEKPSKAFAILDGRQRCTAIAMAFGGLRAEDRKFRFAGRFYLDVATEDPSERVKFLKESDIQRQKLESDASCIGRGLFPLSTSADGEELLSQWMRYLQALKNTDNYPGGKLPPSEELDRRDRVLKRAFEGLVGTKLAVYVVPESYRLSAICEIFETLNTTGTKVSTVDLIHSWLYAETRSDPEGPILLRDWIHDFGQKDGAIGWSSLEDRPELIAQIVTACYVALDAKPTPRRVSGSGIGSVNSVKAGDLLSTPTLHWRSVIQNEDVLARILADFQKLVAGGYFPYNYSPYPVSGAIYIALRWHLHFDQPNSWGRDELNSLYRAFFWRNALSSRYDQGFLTQLAADIKSLKEILARRNSFSSATEWAKFAQAQLSDLMGGLMPTREQLIELVTDGRQTGALQKAVTLPMLAGTRQDLLDPQLNISFPGGEAPELHHIFPKGWCLNSAAGDLARILDKEQAGRDWVDSTANLMPLSRKSNNIWKAKIPGQILREKKIGYDAIKNAAKQAYIDEEGFRYLAEGTRKIEQFWSHRATLIADDLISRTSVTL
jgi:uncharacterized protein DUF262